MMLSVACCMRHIVGPVMRLPTKSILLVISALCAALVLAGCGGDDASSDDPIAAANEVDVASFPKTGGGKTFADLQKEVDAKQDASLLPAANNFVAGRENRLPFGLFDADRNAVWGPTMMYLSTGTDAPAVGPFPVKARSFDIPPEFQSEVSKSDLETVGNGFYTAELPAKWNGDKVNVLTLTQTDAGVQAAATGVTLKKSDPMPAPGEKMTAVKTATLDDVDGDAEAISTRVPPADMHDVSFDEVVGKGKPVVLLMATPKLCSSRVCGPIVDVAAEVQSEAGDDAVFVHQEIFKDNDINAGYVPQLEELGMTMEPVTFVVDGDGVVVAQLQGPFVAEELREALDAAE